MPRARVLIVHDVARTRTLLTDLLLREGMQVEVADSTFDAVARYVEAPADLVVLGLSGLADNELQVIPTLKREPDAPAVVVTFPSSARDRAVQALEEGADGYVLEPFYAPELLAVVRGHLRPRSEPPSSAALPLLAREIAHAVNNPLQVVTLLLQKDKATKKEIVDGVEEQVGRVQQVVAFLKEFGSIPEAEPADHDPVPAVREAAEAAGLPMGRDAVGFAHYDERHLEAALRPLFTALAERAGDHADGARVDLREEDRQVVCRVTLPEQVRWDGNPRELLDAVLVVGGDREVGPGLALPRALLEGMGGSLSVERDERRTVFVVRLPRGRRGRRRPADAER